MLVLNSKLDTLRKTSAASASRDSRGLILELQGASKLVERPDVQTDLGRGIPRWRLVPGLSDRLQE